MRDAVGVRESIAQCSVLRGRHGALARRTPLVPILKVELNGYGHNHGYFIDRFGANRYLDLCIPIDIDMPALDFRDLRARRAGEGFTVVACFRTT